jgi:hypothetical protein
MALLDKQHAVKPFTSAFWQIFCENMELMDKKFGELEPLVH